jgi:hypothetical protein
MPIGGDSTGTPPSSLPIPPSLTVISVQPYSRPQLLNGQKLNGYYILVLLIQENRIRIEIATSTAG